MAEENDLITRSSSGYSSDTDSDVVFYDSLCSSPKSKTKILKKNKRNKSMKENNNNYNSSNINNNEVFNYLILSRFTSIVN